MRAWKVIGKYPFLDDGEITHTEIAIASTTGSYATYTEKVVGNHMDKTETELVELAREAHFKSEYADRAMAESVQKIDELDKAAKDFEEFAKDAKAKEEALHLRMDAAEKDRNTRFEAMEMKVDEAIAELTNLVVGLISFDTPSETEEGLRE